MMRRTPLAPAPPAWHRALAVSTLLAVLAIPGLLPAATATPGARPRPVARLATAQVAIRDFQFVPATLTVPVGARVTWTNRDSDTHTVTEANRRFSSAGLDPGASFSHTFTAPGTYTYFCAIHPHMTGTVIVK